MIDQLRQFASDPMQFFASIIIPTPAGPRALGDCCADFQRADFEALAPSLKALASGKAPPCNRYWIERTKGSSKDGDAAAAALWLLAFSPRKLSLQIAAVDSDQARLIKDAADDRLRLNPYLFGRIESQANRLINPATGSTCEILTSDTASAHGSRPDAVVLNELAHFESRDFCDAVISNTAKNPNTILVVLTNAGFLDSFAYKLRAEAVNSPRWYFAARKEPAPWISPDDVAEQERILPPSMFTRLWRGEWTSGDGDAISMEDLNAAFDLSLQPTLTRHPSTTFIAAGLDLGIKRDRSAFATVGWQPAEGTFRLYDLQSWQPTPGVKVDLIEVRERIVYTARALGINGVWADQYQAELLAAELNDRGVSTIAVPFAGKVLDRMATLTLMVFRERRIKLYADEKLRRGLEQLRVVTRQWGLKLDAPRTDDGHADEAIALVLALLGAGEAATAPPLEHDEPIIDFNPMAGTMYGQSMLSRGRIW